jgi:hypothetical protein
VNRDGESNVADTDFLCMAIRDGKTEPVFDLSGDGQVDLSDFHRLIEMELQIQYGDVTFDGDFDSSDLVRVMTRGEYDDLVEGNSSWADGDWTCDGEFTSSDLVVAFQRSRYESECGSTR